MDPRPDVVSTYRMLRLALAGLAFAILLGAAVQTVQQRCLLTSVSAYWYTPARTVFVACLVAIGVCLLALRGGTWTENLLLNLAGLFAPVVAIVPTQVSRAADLRCLGHAVPQPSGAVIDNGLLVYGALALLGFGVAVRSSHRRAQPSAPGRPGALTGVRNVVRLSGLGLTAVVLLALALWRVLDDDAFVRHAHITSAVAMFAAITLVVAFRTRVLSGLTRRWDVYRDDQVEARLTARSPRLYSAVYAGIALVMLLGTVGAFVVAPHWAYRTIAVETLLLTAFIAFWLVQTRQLGGDDA